MQTWKRGETLHTVGFPAVGGMPAVKPEPVRVLRRADIPGYWIVKFEDGGKLAVHESCLQKL